MKIAVLGYGKQGKSAVEYWKSPENQITVCDVDQNIELPEGVLSRLGEEYLKDLEDFDLIVRSPNVKPEDIITENNLEIIKKVTTPTNEFLRVSPTKNVIGVTGSKGKGTTCSLILEMLKKMGKTVYLGGNFGISPLELLKENIDVSDWVILELANFQLVDLRLSPHLAVCLMISAEHLDWHGTMDKYVESKRMLFTHQTKDDIAIYYAGNKISTDLANSSPGLKIPFYESPGAVVNGDKIEIDSKVICLTSDLKLLGQHNWQNVCAAITTVWQINPDVGSIREALTEFKGLEHRLELVREVDGVSYYNDSFGSMPLATTAAIDSIPGNKIMIIGGFDRMLPLNNLVESVKDKSNEISKVLLIGASQGRVSSEFDKFDFSNYQRIESTNIREIIKTAQKLAKPGDSVILSPGFPSFDMFKNFEERGNSYKEVVNSL